MTATATPAAIGYHVIGLEDLRESPLNPRKHFDHAALDELAASLLASGVLTPLLVRPMSGKHDGSYEIAAGHRRYRAAKQAGLTSVPCIVRPLTDEQFLEILTIENLQRDDLHPLEEAQGFVSLMQKAGYDVAKIAARVGRSAKYVYDRIKLLQLTKEAQELFLENKFTAGHAVLLARLNPEDQERAIAMDDLNDGYRHGGLFTVERALEDPNLEVDDTAEESVKPISVREFQTWIDEHVRFEPTDADPMLFPQTAAALVQAEETETKVVPITHSFVLTGDDVKDASMRTYGSSAWKRADGQQKSKTCEHSAMGLVVAGAGRGDAFLVCIARKKCSVHWAKEIREAAQRAKQAERNGRSTPARSDAEPKKPDPNIIPHELRNKWEAEELEVRVPAFLAGVKKTIGELKGLSDEICWNLGDTDFGLDRWNKVGKHDWRHSGTDLNNEIEDLVIPKLPGKWNGLTPADGAAGRSALALKIWLARDTDTLDEEITKAIAARWKAHRAAEAKKPASADAVKTEPKPKKRLAGDVRREKQAKKAKAAK